MKKPFHIIELCDAPTTAPRVSISGSARNTRIIIQYDDGSEEIVFDGPDFDEKRHAEQMKRIEESGW